MGKNRNRDIMGEGGKSLSVCVAEFVYPLECVSGFVFSAPYTHKTHKALVS